MVKWSEFAISGSFGITPGGLSYTSGSFDTAPIVVLSTTPHETVANLNEEYVKKIDEILALSVGYDDTGNAGIKVMEIKIRYTATGELTKQDMEVLNELWKILTWEQKFHSDKQSTVGKIKKLLGSINDDTD